tara:strand:+ start:120 stop:824 length:705 start_codon:yes stop_codon:yes gene_type:complete
MKKFAILIIATNQYRGMAQSLIESIDNFYSPEGEKDIFIFSDKNEFKSTSANIIFNKIDHEQWPYVTLKRFEYFYKVKEKLKSYDQVIYMDCDLEIVENICFPNSPLIGVMHPAKHIWNNFWDVEKNPKSKAFIPENSDGSSVYCQGCLWGGGGKEISKLVGVLKKNVEIDFNNDVIAKWHDESHLNNYFYNNKEDLLILKSSYCYPENWNLPIKKLIIHKDKSMENFPRHQGK